MKNTLKILALSSFIILMASCGGTKKATELPDITNAEKAVFSQTEGDTIQIVNSEVEYDIIIIEPGFNTWLVSIAKPEGYYSQSFLENRNYLMVTTWNQRVLQPQRYDGSLYEMQVDYQQGIDYGYEVNYKLYNYFIYFQRKYGQRLGPFIPRI